MRKYIIAFVAVCICLSSLLIPHKEIQIIVYVTGLVLLLLDYKFNDRYNYNETKDAIRDLILTVLSSLKYREFRQVHPTTNKKQIRFIWKLYQISLLLIIITLSIVVVLTTTILVMREFS